VSPIAMPCMLRGVSICSVARRLFGGVNVALVRAAGEARSLLPMSVITVAGVSRAKKVHGMVKLRHFIKIFCGSVPRNRLFFGMTTVLLSSGRNFRLPSTMIVTSRRFSSSVASGWDISWCGLSSRAIGLSRKGAWSMAVSFLLSEVDFQSIFGPHLIMDLSIGPDSVSSLMLSV